MLARPRRYVRTIGSTAADPWENGSSYYRWRATLEHFYSQLPAEASWNPINLFSRRNRYQLDLLISIHGWYHQTHCLLHRFVMSGPLEQISQARWIQAPIGWRESVMTTCFEHAISLSELFLRTRSQFPDWTCSTVTAGNLIYASVRHQFHYWMSLGVRPLDAVGPDEHLVRAAPQIIELLQDLANRFLSVRRLVSAIRESARG